MCQAKPELCAESDAPLLQVIGILIVAKLIHYIIVIIVIIITSADRLPSHICCLSPDNNLKQYTAAPLLICFRQNLSEVTASGSLEIPDLSGEVGQEALTRYTA